jgi:hypothetical protein
MREKFSYIIKYIKLPVIVMLIFCAAAPAFSITNALKLKISNAAYSDETVIRYLAGATCGFDGSYDAWKLFSANKAVPAIYTEIAPASDLSINAYPVLTKDEQMQLYVRVGSTGTYTITATEAGVFDAGVDIFIENTQTGNFQNLRTNPIFTFSVADTGAFNSSKGIFKVYFSLPVVFSPVQNSFDDKSTCTITKTGTIGWTYIVKDNNNTVIASTTINNDIDTLFNLSAGVYSFTSYYGNEATKVQTFTIGSIATQLNDPFPKENCKLFFYDNLLTVDFNNIVQQHIVLSVFTIEGREVANIKLQDVSIFTVPVNKLASGVYVIKLQTGETTIIKKVPVVVTN